MNLLLPRGLWTEAEVLLRSQQSTKAAYDRTHVLYLSAGGDVNRFVRITHAHRRYSIMVMPASDTTRP